MSTTNGNTQAHINKERETHIESRDIESAAFLIVVHLLLLADTATGFSPAHEVLNTPLRPAALRVRCTGVFVWADIIIFFCT